MIESNFSAYSVKASAILDELKACGITHVVTVPDYVQLSVHRFLEQGYLPEVSVVPCSTEDEAIVIAAGLYIGGKVPVVIIQNQGLYACVNNLRGMGLDSNVPIFMMIGQFGREFSNLGKDTRDSSRRVVRILEPLLDMLEVPYLCLEGPEDIGNIQKAFEISRKHQSPAALLIGAHTAWD
ncbi:thiamine pyrophosphate-binding protein [Bacillus sp. JJ722]|uniref:thiamine pyrophosphate-binding protein n=1 Tax=Bacillus sp. JJ722 TaxID=3122973 RepID=UPI003000219E